MAIKRILVPTDFSEGSLQAIEYAIDLAQPTVAELIVLFVVEPVYYATPADLYGASANLAMLLEEQQRIGRAQLARLGKRLAQRRARFRTMIETGTPYQLITDTAAKLKADLIVMATHGRTGLSHVLLGSVTEKVVRTAACPVLTLRGRPAARKTRRTAARPRR